MNLMARRRALMQKAASGGSALPFEYQRVEWIGANGTQWISTGVISPESKLNGYSAVVEFAIDQGTPSTTGCIIGASNSSGYLFARLALENAVGFSASQEGQHLAITPNSKTKAEIQWLASSQSATINGQTCSYNKYNLSLSNQLWGIFRNGSTYGGTKLYFSGKIYSVTLYYQSEPVFNGIPCYRKADTIIGMYDTVTDTFFTNAGTGAFTKGNDIN